MRLSVPGNLLLAGEYLVLDEGGQGLAVAVEPRLRASATTSPGRTWSIRAIMGESSLLWHPGGGDDLPLAEAMILSCAEALEVRGKSMPGPLAMEVDSSAFFVPGRRKAGFGSSAATAVAIAMLTGRAAGLKDAHLIDFSVEAALAGHRVSQGGRGSGYDVLASLHGGCGIFTGGTKPGWKALVALPSIHAALVPGPAAVRSAEAVSAFRLWVARQTRKARTILAAMKTSVCNLIQATTSGDADAFRSAMDQAGTAGRQLGDAIGYSAFIAPPPGFEAVKVKALGAGNELGLMLLQDLKLESPDSTPAGCIAFRPTGGPKWLS